MQKRKKKKKKRATHTVMHDTTFSDHTRVSMCKYMNSATENILLYYINYRTYRTGFLGKLRRLPLPSLCHAMHPRA